MQQTHGLASTAAYLCTACVLASSQYTTVPLQYCFGSCMLFSHRVQLENRSSCGQARKIQEQSPAQAHCRYEAPMAAAQLNSR